MQTKTRGTRNTSRKPTYASVAAYLATFGHARNVFERLGAGVRVEGVKLIGGRQVLVGKRIAKVPNDPTIEPIEDAELFVGGTFEANGAFFDAKALVPEPVRRFDTARFMDPASRRLNRGIPLFA
jgi:hypothetical protein